MESEDSEEESDEEYYVGVFGFYESDEEYYVGNGLDPLTIRRPRRAKLVKSWSPWTAFNAARNTSTWAEYASDGQRRLTVPNIGKLVVSSPSGSEEEPLGVLEYKLCDPAPVEPLQQWCECPGVTMIKDNMDEGECNIAEPATHSTASMKQEEELVVDMLSGESLHVKVRVHQPLWTEYDCARPGVFFYYHVTSALVVQPKYPGLCPRKPGVFHGQTADCWHCLEG